MAESAPTPPPPEAAPSHILLVDDQAATRATHTHILQELGHVVEGAANAEEALALYDARPPRLVITDVEMPGRNGFWLARRLRERDDGRWTPILFLSALSDPAMLAEGIEAGGDDFLYKPVHPVVLRAKLRAFERLRTLQDELQAATLALTRSNMMLRSQAERDALTGLLNRRGFDERLDVAMREARRQQQPLTLMLCDVDHFKRFNDRAGHAAGDDCLRQVARLLAGAARRPLDVAARYGGEEFALILPATPRAGAMTLARTVSHLFRHAALAHPDSPTAPWVTVSGGISTCVPDASLGATELLRRADEALYRAKQQGRNRFFSFEMQLDSEER